jgi:hypothetical protein
MNSYHLYFFLVVFFAFFAGAFFFVGMDSSPPFIPHEINVLKKDA